MSEQNITIHTKKYYRVVIEAIEPEQETLDSFTMKLSMRLKITLPRAKIVARNIPCTLRSGLSSSQANQLKAVLESIGARVRLESHLVTPGEGDQSAAPDETRASHGGPKPSSETVKCPSCGWPEKVEARYCSMCHRKFRDPLRREKSLEARAPLDNPLQGETSESMSGVYQQIWERHKLPILLAVGILLVFLLFK